MNVLFFLFFFFRTMAAAEMNIHVHADRPLPGCGLFLDACILLLLMWLRLKNLKFVSGKAWVGCIFSVAHGLGHRNSCTF